MTIVKLKVARIGNSRGVRLPAAALRRYRIGEAVLMEEGSEGILLRPTGPAVEKLSWEETAREMAASREDWSAWDAAASDGLDDVPWRADKQGRVAEPQPPCAASSRRYTASSKKPRFAAEDATTVQTPCEPMPAHLLARLRITMDPELSRGMLQTTSSAPAYLPRVGIANMIPTSGAMSVAFAVSPIEVLSLMVV